MSHSLLYFSNPENWYLLAMLFQMQLSKSFAMILIGKNANLRFLKQIKSLPCNYISQAKSWMDSEIFTSLVECLDRLMIANRLESK